MTINTTKKGLTGFALKYIALLSMTIDHFSAIFLEYGTTAYTLGRGIGRVAFPLYCFLLVEGYFHTSNHKSYLKRLFLFAIISEIPFDMAFYKFPLTSDLSTLTGHQNVYFTLAFGFLAMYLIDRYWQQNTTLAMVSTVIIATAAELLHFDYGSMGILVILIFYAYQKFYTNRSVMQGHIIALLPLLTYGNFCVYLALPLLALYHGEKGNVLPHGKSFPGAKYLFYVYYPLHLFVLGSISMCFFS